MPPPPCHPKIYRQVKGIEVGGGVSMQLGHTGRMDPTIGGTYVRTYVRTYACMYVRT